MVYIWVIGGFRDYLDLEIEIKGLFELEMEFILYIGIRKKN